MDALRTECGLSRAALLRLLGVSTATLTRWERGEGQPDPSVLVRAARLEGLLRRLTGVMRREFLPTWLETPNEACKEAGGKTPLDLLEREAYEQIEDMIFYVESGIPT
jgi:transcriptional regulator with XRE-family HTH domain